MNDTNGKRVTDWRSIVLALLMGLVGGGSIPVLAPPIVRPDPFFGEQAKALEMRIEARRKDALDRLRLEMRVKLPPFATRRRILALEEAVRVIQPGYRPPSSLWHDE